MRNQLIPWPLLSILACFSESDSNSSSAADTGSSGELTSGSSGATSTATSTSTDPSTSAATTVMSTTDTSTTDTSTTEPPDPDSGGTDTAPDCELGFEPVPPIPLSWGPGIYALAIGGRGGPVPACPDPLLFGGEAIEAPFGGTCECSCAPACWVNVHDGNGCAEPLDVFFGYDEECADFVGLVGDPAPSLDLLEDDLADFATCWSPIVEPSFTAGGRYAVCEDASGDGCIPLPRGSGLVGPCVAHAGDLPCPAEGPYTERHFTADSVTPNCQACDPCSDAAITACQAASATLYSDHGCAGEAQVVSDTSCSSEIGRSAIIDFALSCPPAQEAGEPVLGGERTFCCVP